MTKKEKALRKGIIMGLGSQGIWTPQLENIMFNEITEAFINIMERETPLKILQFETGCFEEDSRLREDILDAMIAFRKINIPSKKDINNAALIDYENQNNYDNDAYDRQEGFKAGVEWLLSVLK